MTDGSRCIARLQQAQNSRYKQCLCDFIVSALDKNDDLESLKNNPDESATDLETDFEKHDDGIGLSTVL